MILAFTLSHNGEIVDRRYLEYHDYQVLAWIVREWLAIEVAPFWRDEIERGVLLLTWTTDDLAMNAAMFGIAISWHLSGQESRSTEFYGGAV